MRTHRWLKALTCGLCLGAAADAALAQAPAPGGGAWVTADGSPVGPQPGGSYYPYSAVPPGAYQPPYGTHDPNVLYPPQTPEGYSPWPQVSPYGMGNYASDSLYDHNGNWFRQILNKRRDYYFSIDALAITGRAPGHARVGARIQDLDHVTRGLQGFTVPTYGVGAVGAAGGNNNNNGGINPEPDSRVFIDTGVIPFPFMFEAGDPNPIATVDNTLYPIRNFSLFSEFRAPGLQLNWGFFDESGGGFKASGWWGFENSQSFQRGEDSINGVTLTQDIIINQAGRMLFSKNGAVPWDTGIPTSINELPNPGNNGGVVGTQKYDVMYRLHVSQQMGGGDMQFYMPDLLTDQSAVRVRPVWSGKYIYLNEDFAFRGIDSGLSYALDGETGVTSTTTFRPTGPPFTVNSDLFESHLNARTDTHLAGPTFGFRYDLGHSREFNIWGQTSGGLLANYETVRINGFNAGESVVTEFLTNTNMLDGDSHFEDHQTHAHVSPMFEQSFFAESRVLRALPVIKEVPFLAAANFRLGYTYTLVGQVARPYNSVQWNGFPRQPKVDINYQNWYVGRLSFGLEWVY